MAPAESLLQAAGRANREGHRPAGRLVVLTGDAVQTLAAYRTGIAKTDQHFRDGRMDLDDPQAMDTYYRSLYTALDPDNHPDTEQMRRWRDSLQLTQVGEHFRMIDDDSLPVLVRYDPDAVRAIDALTTAGAPTRDGLRAVQPYTVSLPARIATRTDVAPHLPEILPGVRVWSGPYDPLVGVDTAAGLDSIW